MKNENLESLDWQKHSHVSYTNYYLSTSVATLPNGEKIYRHARTRRLDFFRLGKTTVKYSKTMDSKNITEEAVNKMIECAIKMVKK